jgi:hypothetical protein
MTRHRPSNPDSEFLWTGEAAAMLGYSPAGFRRRFTAMFLEHQALFCDVDGQWKWSRDLVQHLRDRDALS